MKSSKAKTIALKSARRLLGTKRREALAERNPDMLFIGEVDDPTFDEALIGSVEIPCQGHVACYDYDKCVECLLATYADDDDEPNKRESALEWMEFNVVGSYVGKEGPVFFHSIQDDE